MLNLRTDDLVAKYVQLRDRKAEMKKAYDLQVAGVDALMDKLEAVFLKMLAESGEESKRTTAGTVYRSTSTSATVADKDVFLEHVRTTEAWELLDVRANKTAIQQHKSNNEALPPGINWREELKVGVRRS